MRFAREFYQKHKTDPLFNDAGEIAVSAGGAALLQAIFSDMSVGEIAGMGALGVGVGAAAKPLASRGGRSLGRMIDKRMGSGPVSMTDMHEIHQKALGDKPLPFLSDGMNKNLKEYVNNRVTSAYTRPDGKYTGPAEGLIGGIARAGGDNVALYGFGAMTAAGLSDDRD